METHLVDPHGQLIHSCRGDHMGYDGLLEDYAYDGWALLELFRSTGEERYLHRRRNWPGRWKSGSEIRPAASISMGRRVNSWWSGPRRPMTGGALRQLMAALVLLRLSRYTGEDHWKEAADRQLEFLRAAPRRRRSSSPSPATRWRRQRSPMVKI